LVAEVGVEQPLFLHEDVLPAIPRGWVWSRSDSLVIQLKPGKLFDTKTVAATGSVPVLNQSENGVLGYHDEEPGVVASAGAPVVTFANHTCAMRLVKHPFSAIQNIFPKIGKQGVCDTVWFYYALLGRVRTNEYKGHHPLFRDAFVPVPSLAVQRRIASILSAYDDLIENNTRRISILEEMARRIYEEWFVRFRFPGHEGVRMVESELGLVPEGWRSLPLAAFGDVITGKTPSKANPDFFGTVVPFLKTPDMHGNLFILATGECLSREGAESQRNKTIPARSLCVSCIGTIGVVSITTEPCQTNQQINSLVPADGAALEFLYFRLKDSKKTLENLGANGATMGNVNKSKFEALSVLTPSRDLLKAFHAEVAPMFGLIEALSRKNVNLRATRDLLLPRLISGELDVSAMPEPEALAA
jgi:restriction endonuclease S subunit